MKDCSIIRIIKVTLLMFLSVNTFADLGGKNVILIHGFNPFQLLSPPADNGRLDAEKYWRNVDSRLQDEHNGLTNIIHWPSNKRLTGAGGVISIVKPQIEALVTQGYCDDQCVIVTHSTGDLVARFLLKNRNSILGSQVASRFKVAAVVDLAGAGGGTELANIGVGIANGINFGGNIVSAMLDYAGFGISLGLDVGILNDLQTTVARNHATGSIPAIPRIRFAGTGDEFYGFATHGLISGADDSVVPLHSACGSAFAHGYQSCSQDVRIDGRLTRVSSAPNANELYDFHYPLVMSETLEHNGMQSNSTGNWMTFISSQEDQYNRLLQQVPELSFDDYTKREWWDFWRTYRYLKDANYKSMTTIVADAF